MKKNYIIATLLGLAVLVFLYLVHSSFNPQVEQNAEESTQATSYEVTPVSHASFALALGEVEILNDPVGDASQYEAFPSADLILLSDIHGDHLNIETLSAVVASETVIIAPQAVYDELTQELQAKTVIMGNGDVHSVADISIEAIPMYNLPTEGPDYRHVKGRGNGYVLEQNETRIYIAGDTEDIPEMRALTDIDVAFVPMNLPFTMDVATAANGVLAFAPAIVYPYHYRGPEGLSDVGEFARLVTEGNPEIEVVLLDWYAQ